MPRRPNFGLVYESIACGDPGRQSNFGLAMESTTYFDRGCLPNFGGWSEDAGLQS